MNLVPIKVKLGTRRNGEADHPNFNILSVVQSSGVDWSKYIDINGSGWLYDNSCGHKEFRTEGNEWDSPNGIQWAIALVPQQFATEAIAVYPDKVEQIDELRCEAFYDSYHAKDFDEEEIDTDKLNAIKAKEDAGVLLSPADLDARNPVTETRGIRKNKRKHWVDFKAMKGYTIA